MLDHDENDLVRRTFTVPVSRESAFGVFTDGLGTWWPPEYTWAGDTLETIAVEPEEGGRCFERGPHGFELDFGHVVRWDPPGRIVFSWQIGPSRVPQPDPERASEIDVRFEADGPEVTEVAFVHRGFDRHGEGAEDYRRAMDSPRGWDYILERYRAAVE